MTARVNIYDELYEKLITDRGHWADWERAAVCHCVTRDSGQPNFMCPTCHGLGYKYLPPKRILLAVTSLSGQVEQKNLEVREPGTAYVTPKADVIMGYRDRLRFPDFKCMFSEVVHWNFALWGRGISPKTYRNIKEVVALTDGEFEYEAGIDYEITEDCHHLRWLNDEYTDKIDGRNMSILYVTTPSYFVSDLLHELRATITDRKTNGELKFIELPKQYKIQREDFIYGVKEPDPVVSSNSSDVEIKYDADGGITI